MIGSQSERVAKTMKKGSWKTLDEISKATEIENLTSVSARLRGLRAEGYTVEKRFRKNTTPKTYEYKVISA